MASCGLSTRSSGRSAPSSSGGARRTGCTAKSSNVTSSSAVGHGVTQGIFLEGGAVREMADCAHRNTDCSHTSLAGCHAPRRVTSCLSRSRSVGSCARRSHAASRSRSRPGRPSRLQATVTAALWLAKNAGLYARGGSRRLRIRLVNFGAPVSLRRYLDQRAADFETLDDPDRIAETARLATSLMDGYCANRAGDAVSLVATALLSFEGATATHALLTKLRERARRGTGIAWRAFATIRGVILPTCFRSASAC